MDAILNVVQYFVDLGAAVMLPIVIFVIALLLGTPVSRAVKCGISIGIGFVAIKLHLSFLAEHTSTKRTRTQIRIVQTTPKLFSYLKQKIACFCHPAQRRKRASYDNTSIRAHQGGAGSVRSVAVAELLNVSKASVNKALTSLRERGFVVQPSYGQITLTADGEQYASNLWRCHRVLRKFLTHVLEVNEETADYEACLMEHALSRDTQDRLITYLEGEGISIDEG